ncbi:MAG: glycosyl hydrolase family 65 protein [Pirellula sp.]
MKTASSIGSSAGSSIERIAIAILFLCIQACLVFAEAPKGELTVLKSDRFQEYVEYFNRMEREGIRQAIPNADAWNWMKSSIPFFECPQDNFEEIYYFRWWSLRKHIRETPSGFAMTEFLVPRSYADQHNLISCALGHHIMEARWIRDSKYLDQYIHVWFRGNNGAPMSRLHKFSSWAPFAFLEKYHVDGDKNFLVNLLPDAVAEYEFWEREHLRTDGLYWQYDVRDGMEEQISGGRTVKNARPTINSYMAGNAGAISRIAALADNSAVATKFQGKADSLKRLVLEKLWNPKSQFFETVKEDGSFAEVREQIGFIPWYFRLANRQHDRAWELVNSERGFLAPYGLTTAERSHPKFRTNGCCNCEWDGAVWPFATSQTLTGMANRIGEGDCREVDRADYMRHLELYVESQYHRGRPYVGEYLDEVTGYWLKGDQERSRNYNHSTFSDLIITGLIGLRPREDDEWIEVQPLVPEVRWDWFCLDGVKYHGRDVAIVWDKDGSRYQRGKGLIVFVNGKEVGRSDDLTRLICHL